MIKSILILISTILILTITYQFFVNQKTTDPIKPNIKLKPINTMTTEKNVTILNKKNISTINESNKSTKPIGKHTFQGDVISMDLTYEPLLNKTEKNFILNKEFEEIEKNIRHKIIHLDTNTTIPYNNDISLHIEYDKIKKNSNINEELSQEQIREYEGNIVLPENSILYLYQDENISSIIDPN